MKNHTLIKYSDHWTVLGKGSYFSWIITFEYEEYTLSTIYGSHIKTFKTLEEAIDHVENGMKF